MLLLNPVILTKLEKETSWLQAPTAWECHPPGCRTRTTLKNIPNHPETLTVDTELGCGVWPKLSKVFWRERELQVKQLQPNMKEAAESETATTKHERDSWKWNSYNQTWKSWKQNSYNQTSKRQLQVKQLQPALSVLSALACLSVCMHAYICVCVHVHEAICTCMTECKCVFWVPTHAYTCAETCVG